MRSRLTRSSDVRLALALVLAARVPLQGEDLLDLPGRVGEHHPLGGPSDAHRRELPHLGAEHLFAQRAASREVAREIFAQIQRYRDYAARNGSSLSENPSPGNKEGGLLNITINRGLVGAALR